MRQVLSSSRWRLPLFFAAFVSATTPACDAPLATDPGDNVRFVAPLDARLFAAGSSLQIQIWNGEQLDALERNARCASVHDPATGTSGVQCPEGITYQPVSPEEFEIPVAGITGGLSLRSATVRIGDRFRILLSGKSLDGCNRTSAERRARAGAAEVLLDGLDWTTTARACLNP